MAGVLLCLGTKKGEAVLHAVSDRLPELDLYVCTFKEKGVVESFDGRIRDRAAAENATVLRWSEIRDAGGEFFEERGIGLVLLVGWRSLLPMSVVDALASRVVVAHDSLLPKLRGFAPLATALLIGEKEVGVTFFHVAEEVDAGDVILQKRLPVGVSETIQSLTDRIAPLYAQGAVEVIDAVLNGTAERRPQRDSEATYSVWRDEVDYFVDWSQPAEQIERHIRASGPPYEGARCRLGESVVLIEEAVVEPDLEFAIRQAGKIWRLSSRGEPVVICGSGLLRVTKATVEGRPLVPLKRLRLRFS